MTKHILLGAILTATLAVSTAGCGPRLSDEDLGEKLNTLPVIEGVDQPYPLPELDDLEEPTDDSPGSTPPVPTLPVPTVGPQK